MNRRKEGYLSNVTGELRLVSRMIHTAEEATDPERQKRYDGTIERVISDIAFSIDEAYEDVSGHAIGTERFMKRCQSLGSALQDLVREDLSQQEKVSLREVLSHLSMRIDKALEALA